MTASDLISASLRKIGVLASGESLPSSDGSDALTTLNNLIDSWSTQNLLIPNKVRDVLALSANTATYTIGTGGTWNVSRPMKIENALIQITSNTPTLELPMRILNKDEYAGILLKGLTNTYPLYLYNDEAYPLSTVSVFPVPNATANNVVLYSWKPLSTLAALTTSFSLPPGYLRALTYALALELAPEYGKQVSENVMMLASESKAEIKRMNVTPKYLRVDDSLLARPAIWNWYTGEPV